LPATGEIVTSRTAEATAAVHARLLKDSALQFDFKAEAPPKPPQWPDWLRAIFDALSKFFGAVFHGATPVMTYVFWAGVAVAVALVLFLIVREVAGVRLARRRRARAPKPGPLDWRPDAARARALLEDADRLAAQGAYGEAAHLLLYRSIEDIEGRRPRLVKPALTARDIAVLEAVPGAARQAFGLIAQVVEASFFGGSAVDREGFDRCRRAYEDFAFPEAWA